MDLDEHLFRSESGRIVTALTRIFGLENLPLAEDVAQDAFCRALEVWKLHGVPDNPSAWLMKTARNRAIDVLRRRRTAHNAEPALRQLFESEWTLVPTVREIFEARTIADDQLRMMFSCCQPRLSQHAQVALVLHLLCGFSVQEIANAFLSGRAATEKRIARAKKVLQASRALFDLADRDVAKRLAAVQRTLYLLFNEGYHGASAESVVRVELCREAMRLGALLLEHPATATPATHALCALMWLDAARLPARLDAQGDLLPLLNQDRSRWDRALIVRGQRLLELSASGPDLTEYHVEAAIASLHSCASRPEDTQWSKIVELYGTLMEIKPSPVVALNRAIAVAQHEGPERGLEELGRIAGADRLAAYPFYCAARGELELRRGDRRAAASHFRKALALARNPSERRFFEQRVGACAPRTHTQPV